MRSLTSFLLFAGRLRTAKVLKQCLHYIGTTKVTESDLTYFERENLRVLKENNILLTSIDEKLRRIIGNTNR